MRFKTVVTVTLRPTILDPEGKAIEHALGALAIGAFSGVRVGKRIELFVDAPDAAAARTAADEAASRLLANTVMEDYTVDIVETGA